MGKLLEIITPLHKRTTRDYVGRMQDRKVECMKIGRKYGRDYWDGDRRFGYGGYKYDGRWSVVAEKLIKQYNLPENAKILDVGCGNIMPNDACLFGRGGHQAIHGDLSVFKQNV